MSWRDPEASGGRLLIIGSGPVGMACALLLREHFDEVILLERQPKEKFLSTSGPAFPIVFSPAAIAVLEEVGAWESIQLERSPFFGVTIHKRLLGHDFTFTSTQDEVFSHWRNHVVAALYERVASVGLDVHFQAEVEEIDFESSTCNEKRLGSIDFDLLLGADGINSMTRGLMADAQPDLETSFRSTPLDAWFAYSLASEGPLREKFGGGERCFASNVYVDDLAEYPSDRFRVVTTSMTQPCEQINVLIKHDPSLDPDRVRELNDSFFGPYVDSIGEIDEAWRVGHSGRFAHVEAPKFHLNSALLVGDAAHGFESTGDLVNVGLASVAALRGVLIQSADVPSALEQYDQTTGEALRFYSSYAFRRSMEKITVEVASFEVAAFLGVTRRHPSLFGIFEDEFEIDRYMGQYRKDLLTTRLLLAAASVVATAACVAIVKRAFGRATSN